MIDYTTVSGDTQDTLVRLVTYMRSLKDRVESEDKLFNELSVDCVKFCNGGCLLHEECCSPLNCPLGKV